MSFCCHIGVINKSALSQECVSEEHEEEYWHNVLQTNDIHALTPEVVAVEADLTYEEAWTYYPTEEDTGTDGYEWHEEVVGNVVEDVEYLCYGAVWQCELEVEHVVAEAHDD